jgi:hypothetical protein
MAERAGVARARVGRAGPVPKRAHLERMRSSLHLFLDPWKVPGRLCDGRAPTHVSRKPARARASHTPGCAGRNQTKAMNGISLIVFVEIQSWN